MALFSLLFTNLIIPTPNISSSADKNLLQQENKMRPSTHNNFCNFTPCTTISVISLRKILWHCVGNRASTPTSSSFFAG